jgi:hypothetical protein
MLTFAVRGKTISAEAVAASKTIATPEAVVATEAVVAAETVATPEAVTAAETIAAKSVTAAEASTVARRSRRLGLGRAGVHAMDSHDLQTPRRILQITDYRRPRRNILRADLSEGGGMAERVAAIFKRDETVALGRIEPFDRTFGRGHGQRPRTVILEICHQTADKLCRTSQRCAVPDRPQLRRSRLHNAQNYSSTATGGRKESWTPNAGRLRYSM